MSLPEVKEISLNQIEISLFNIRVSNPKEGIEELASNIEKIGLQQPIVLSKKGKGKFDLISGQRRFLAFLYLYKKTKESRWSKIPAIIIEVQNETDGVIKSFSENILRLPVTEDDKMQAATRLLSKLGNIGEVAKHLGVSQKQVRIWLDYEGTYDFLREMVNRGEITPNDAKRITKTAPDEKRAEETAKEVAQVQTVRGRDKREIKNVVIDTAKEKPEISVKEIAEEVIKEPPPNIKVHLTKMVANALKKASEAYNSTDEEIAAQAIEEWLSREGFLNE